MKIIVTGCCGFIGSHLTEKLINSGYEVVGIDNMNDYYSSDIKFKNLKILKELSFNYSNFIFFQEDIRQTKHILSWKPNIVIHLAAMAGVRYSLENPSIYTDVNVTGFINIIEQCRLVKCRLIYASSSSVYGLNTKIPFNENDIIEKCNSPYSASKRAKEILSQTYSQLYSLETIGLRFFTVYGPRGRPDMAPYKFINNIKNGISIDKYGTGISSRDYTYISDIIDGIIACLTVKLKNNNEIYNLGNENPISLNEFISVCENITGKKAIINELEEQLGDVNITYADITKARNELNYYPKVKIEEGLKTLLFNI